MVRVYGHHLAGWATSGAAGLDDRRNSKKGVASKLLRVRRPPLCGLIYYLGRSRGRGGFAVPC